tara:strand:+ start:27859 stop:28929 length:1071 start_codon:yes stop_codon:yes gene_type:complete
MWDDLPPECLMLIMKYYIKHERVNSFPWSDKEQLKWNEWINLDIRMPSDSQSHIPGQEPTLGDRTDLLNICESGLSRCSVNTLMRLSKGIEKSEGILWPEYVIKCARKKICRIKKCGRNTEPVNWRLSLINYTRGKLYDTPSKYDWSEPDFKKVLRFCSISKGTRVCCDNSELWYNMVVDEFRNGREYTRIPTNPKINYLTKANKVLVKRYTKVECAMGEDLDTYLENITKHNTSINILKDLLTAELNENNMFSFEDPLNEGIPKIKINRRNMISIPNDYIPPNGLRFQRSMNMLNIDYNDSDNVTPRYLTINQAHRHIKEHERILFDSIRYYNNIRETLVFIRPILSKIKSMDIL